jgi:hypothetical protein
MQLFSILLALLQSFSYFILLHIAVQVELVISSQLF